MSMETVKARLRESLHRTARNLLLTTGALMVSACVTDDPGNITFDRGGTMLEYSTKVNALKAKGEVIRIMRHCYSACTVYLANPKTCVGPEAELWFHAPNPNTEFHRNWLGSHYPPQIKAWIARQGGLTPDWIVLKGEELRAMNLPSCEDEPATGARELPRANGSGAVKA
jgi:hypothetical protein